MSSCNPVEWDSSTCFTQSSSIALNFNNEIDSDSLDILTYHYLYNGGGVGIADFNNDGNKDLFLGGNMVSSKLLLGDGQMNFEDVTMKVGLETNVWVNGISLVDLNNDGWKDIYLSVGGPECDISTCRNMLFLNRGAEGTLSFEEIAKNLGIDHAGYSQQALFFDADNDGDLDMYQVQNFVDPKSKNYPQPKRYFSKQSYDRFFLNQEAEGGFLKFIDASKEWNVDLPGFGLGIAMADINRDGYQDLYIANDFITDDIVYINQEGKGFVNEAAKLLKHSSYNSMGVDLADLNNDLMADILVVDMLPFDNQRQKTMLGAMNYDKYLLSREEGYSAQFIRNTLQISNGISNEEVIPYSDVAPILGLHQTDWSWSPLIADFDNNAETDIFISNGYGKNITDLDFVNYNSAQTGFGGRETAMLKMKEDIKALPAVELPNQLFLGNDTRAFEKFSEFRKGITNGVAYGDLDNDGDLDLVLNNLDAASEVLKNETELNFLRIALKGPDLNKDAIGAEVTIVLSSGKHLVKTQSPVRSYLSCMSDELLFGLGADSLVQVEVRWPDNGKSSFSDVKANQLLRVDHQTQMVSKVTDQAAEPLFFQKALDTAERSSFMSGHDFSIQPLLMKACRKRPRLMAWSPSSESYLIANFDGPLSQMNLDLTEKRKIDFGKDEVISDLSLIENGGSELVLVNSYDYNNLNSFLSAWDYGTGKWRQVTRLELPPGIYNHSVSRNDDNIRLLVGRYPGPKDYPTDTIGNIYSFDLINKQFVSNAISFSSTNHCITDIAQCDLGGDANSEIIIVGEWMSPVIGSLENGKFSEWVIPVLDSLKGIWQDIETADFDGDGDLDILLANLGNNTRHKFDHSRPLIVVADDLDDNGSIDPILSHLNEYNNRVVSYHSRDDISRQLPSLKLAYPNYQSFASASFSEIVRSFKLDVKTLSANYSESVLLENKGNADFKLHRLPPEVQYSIVNKFSATDVNRDGLIDIVAMTNCNSMETHNGCLDGLNGLVLINQGNLSFEALTSAESGLNISGTGFEFLSSAHKDYHLATSDNAIYSLIRSRNE